MAGESTSAPVPTLITLLGHHLFLAQMGVMMMTTMMLLVKVKKMLLLSHGTPCQLGIGHWQCVTPYQIVSQNAIVSSTTFFPPYFPLGATGLANTCHSVFVQTGGSVPFCEKV